MAYYAFKNKDHLGNLTGKIYATQALQGDLNQPYYCPNPACDALLYICSAQGSRQPYFSANHADHRHIFRCAYGSDLNFDKNNYDENSFDYNTLFNNLTSDNQKNNHRKNANQKGPTQHIATNIHPIRTIRQLYFMCKSSDIHDTYNGFKIWCMLLDSRSLPIYEHKTLTNCLIETTVSHPSYNNIKNEVYLELDSYTLTLNFNENKLFKSIKNTVFNNSDKLVIVAGDWQMVAPDHYQTTIQTKKQIMVLH
ncbi:hypothetical protein ABVC38_00395 [Lactobacillus iners]|uniref:hypothetical protein n=1 Tax=Lactobacillus iners TaxID=147802 RepID=UPI00336A4396